MAQAFENTTAQFLNLPWNGCVLEGVVDDPAGGFTVSSTCSFPSTGPIPTIDEIITMLTSPRNVKKRSLQELLYFSGALTKNVLAAAANDPVLLAKMQALVSNLSVAPPTVIQIFVGIQPSPSPSRSPSRSPSTANNVANVATGASLSDGAIAGIAVAGFFLFFGVCAAAYFYNKFHADKRVMDFVENEADRIPSVLPLPTEKDPKSPPDVQAVPVSPRASAEGVKLDLIDPDEEQGLPQQTQDNPGNEVDAGQEQQPAQEGQTPEYVKASIRKELVGEGAHDV